MGDGVDLCEDVSVDWDNRRAFHSGFHEAYKFHSPTNSTTTSPFTSTNELIHDCKPINTGTHHQQTPLPPNVVTIVSHKVKGLAVEALNVSILHVRNNNLFHGVKLGVDNVHISHLQFADDALIMGEWSLLNAKNLSRILTCFHLASGLKVNFHKSNLFGVGVTNSEVKSLASTIGCPPSHFSCTYLGLPIGGNMARCANWSILADKFQKRLSKWKSKSLSFGGRLTLVKFVLASLGGYYFSTFKAPLNIINKLECIRSKFFWGGSSNEKKIAWINWDKATSLISNGGLGIGTLKSSNQAILCKWWWRLHNENNARWHKVIRSIHGLDGSLNDFSSIKSKSGPWFRIAKLKEDLCKVGIDFPIIFKKKIGNGYDTRFWHANLLGGSPLKVDFLRLFRLDSNPHCLVCNRSPTFHPLALTHVVPDTDFFVTRPLPHTGLEFHWAWRRPIRSRPESDDLTALCDLVAQLRLTGNVFTWKTANQRLPTRSNQDFRGIDLHSVLCPLCEEVTKTEEHIFVSCGIAKEIWKGLVDWWNIHRIIVTCLSDEINLADMVPLTTAAKKFFDTVVQATLWRFRNEMIFASKRPNKRLILDDIKLSSFTCIMTESEDDKGGSNVIDFSSPYYLHHSDSPKQPSVNEVLTDGNYNDWAREMTNFLFAKNKTDFVDGTLKKQETSSSVYTSWMRCDAMIKGWLTTAMEKSIRDSVKYANTSSEIWSDLKERFGKESAPKAYELKKMITATRQEGSNVSTYDTLLRQRLQCNQDPDLNNKIGTAYHIVAEDERQRAISLENQAVLEPVVFKAFQRRDNNFRSSKEKYMAKQEKENKQNDECTFCKKRGHKREGCFKLVGNPDWWPGKKDDKAKPKAAYVETGTSPIPGLNEGQYQEFVKFFRVRVITLKQNLRPT
uniref:RNA-directed DNA polymerase, eukaryota, reverse transcriptase zinc-binding domain protein n=1 Tax=Tanacetum cinerariifolium TaxID=118510 RepID=A0A699GI42_TANCI|nr:hypothetical protein [Tanacetum cinerariifolium]